jgi:hypothetical protein
MFEAVLTSEMTLEQRMDKIEKALGSNDMLVRCASRILSADLADLCGGPE